MPGHSLIFIEEKKDELEKEIADQLELSGMKQGTVFDENDDDPEKGAFNRKKHLNLDESLEKFISKNADNVDINAFGLELLYQNIREAFEDKVPQLIEYQEKGYNTNFPGFINFNTLKMTLSEKEKQGVPAFSVEDIRPFQMFLNTANDLFREGRRIPAQRQELFWQANSLASSIFMAITTLDNAKEISNRNWLLASENVITSLTNDIIKQTASETRNVTNQFPVQKVENAENENARFSERALRAHLLYPEIRGEERDIRLVTLIESITLEKYARLSDTKKELIKNNKNLRAEIEKQSAYINRSLVELAMSEPVFAVYETVIEGGGYTPLNLSKTEAGKNYIAKIMEEFRNHTNAGNQFTVETRLLLSMRDALDALSEMCDISEKQIREIQLPAGSSILQKSDDDARLWNEKSQKSGNLKDTVKRVPNKLLKNRNILDRLKDQNRSDDKVKVDWLVEDSALITLDVIQQFERVLKLLPTLSHSIANALNMISAIKQAKEGARSNLPFEAITVLVGLLNKEEQKWQENAISYHEKIKNYLAPFNRLKSNNNIRLVYELLIELDSYNRIAWLEQKTRPYKKTITDTISALESVANRMNTDFSRSQIEIFKDAKYIQKMITKWANKLNLLKDNVKTSSTSLLNYPVNSFSRAGLVARSISDWAEELKAEFLSGLPEMDKPEAEKLFDTAVLKVIEDRSTIFTKKTDVEAHRFQTRLNLALSHAKNNTQSYPLTTAEIMSGSMSTLNYIKRWSSKKLFINSINTLLKRSLISPAQLIFLAPRIILRSAHTAYIITSGVRKLEQSVRPGAGPAAASKKKLIYREIKKGAWSIVMTASSALKLGVASSIIIARLNAEGFFREGEKTERLISIVKNLGVHLKGEAKWKIPDAGVFTGAHINDQSNDYQFMVMMQNFREERIDPSDEREDINQLLASLNSEANKNENDTTVGLNVEVDMDQKQITINADASGEQETANEASFQNETLIEPGTSSDMTPTESYAKPGHSRDTQTDEPVKSSQTIKRTKRSLQPQQPEEMQTETLPAQETSPVHQQTDKDNDNADTDTEHLENLFNEVINSVSEEDKVFYQELLNLHKYGYRSLLKNNTIAERKTVSQKLLHYHNELNKKISSEGGSDKEKEIQQTFRTTVIRNISNIQLSLKLIADFKISTAEITSIHDLLNLNYVSTTAVKGKDARISIIRNSYSNLISEDTSDEEVIATFNKLSAEGKLSEEEQRQGNPKKNHISKNINLSVTRELEAANFRKVINALKIMAVRKFYPQTRSDTSCLKLYNRIASGKSRRWEEQFELELFVNSRLFLIANHLRTGATDIHQMLNDLAIEEFFEFNELLFTDAAFNYAVGVRAPNEYRSLARTVSLASKDNKGKDPGVYFYSLYNRYINNYATLEARDTAAIFYRANMDELRSYEEVFKPAAIETYHLHVTYYPKLSEMTGEKEKLLLDKKLTTVSINLISMKDGVKYIYCTIGGQPSIKRVSTKNFLRLQSVLSVSDKDNPQLVPLFNEILGSDFYDVLNQNINKSFPDVLNGSAKIYSGYGSTTNSNTLNEFIVKSFHDILTGAANALKEGAYQTPTATFLSLIPFYSVVARSVLDNNYNPTASDMVWDIVDVTLSYGMPLAFLLFKTSKQAISIMNASLKALKAAGDTSTGFALTLKTFRLALPKLKKLMPSASAMLNQFDDLAQSFVDLTIDTFNPLGFFWATGQLLTKGAKAVRKAHINEQLLKKHQKYKAQQALNALNKADLGDLGSGATSISTASTKVNLASKTGKAISTYLDNADEVTTISNTAVKSSLDEVANSSSSIVKGAVTNSASSAGLSVNKTQQAINELPAELTSDSVLRKYASEPESRCYDAAQRVIPILKKSGYETKVIGTLVFKSVNDTAPLNHYSVIARKGDTELVIDVTFEQFVSHTSRNQTFSITSLDEWHTKIADSDKLKNQLVIVKQYDQLADAKNEIHLTDGSNFLESRYALDPEFVEINVPGFFARQLDVQYKNDVKALQDPKTLRKLNEIDHRIILQNNKLNELKKEKNRYIKKHKSIPPSLTDNIVKTTRKISELNHLKGTFDRIKAYLTRLNKIKKSTSELLIIPTSLSQGLRKGLSKAMAFDIHLFSQIDQIDEAGIVTIGGKNFLAQNDKLYPIVLDPRTKRNAFISIKGEINEIEYVNHQWTISKATVTKANSSIISEYFGKLYGLVRTKIISLGFIFLGGNEEISVPTVKWKFLISDDVVDTIAKEPPLLAAQLSPEQLNQMEQIPSENNDNVIYCGTDKKLYIKINGLFYNFEYHDENSGYIYDAKRSFIVFLVNRKWTTAGIIPSAYEFSDKDTNTLRGLIDTSLIKPYFPSVGDFQNNDDIKKDRNGRMYIYFDKKYIEVVQLKQLEYIKNTVRATFNFYGIKRTDDSYILIEKVSQTSWRIIDKLPKGLGAFIKPNNLFNESFTTDPKDYYNPKNTRLFEELKPGFSFDDKELDEIPGAPGKYFLGGPGGYFTYSQDRKSGFLHRRPYTYLCHYKNGKWTVVATTLAIKESYGEDVSKYIEQLTLTLSDENYSPSVYMPEAGDFKRSDSRNIYLNRNGQSFISVNNRFYRFSYVLEHYENSISAYTDPSTLGYIEVGERGFYVVWNDVTKKWVRTLFSNQALRFA